MSALEDAFAVQLRATGAPAPEREYRFAPPRRWRFDFAWRFARLAVEIEGGAWTRGRHTRGDGFTRDLEKYNEAVLAGWRVLRFTAAHVRSGYALAATRRALWAERAE
jgi:very-short-patch-repair endonuclease